MLGRQGSSHSDPRYKQAYAHMQAGRWSEAIATLQALLYDFPDDESLQKDLENARLKASFDSTTKVHAQRWQVSWKTLLFRILAIATIVAVIGVAFWLITKGVLPALSQSQTERQRAELLSQAKAYLQAEELDKAEESFTALLQAVPGHEEAIAGLEQIKAKREIQALYQQGVDAQERGDITGALAAFVELSGRSPGYRDTNSRIETLKRQQDIETLYTSAEEAFSTGNQQEALDKFLQVKALNARYKANEIAERLFTIYMRLGRELIEKRPASPSDVELAADYFTDALTYKPRDPGALQEQQYAEMFTKGRTAYQEGRWLDATLQLKALYESQPDYLGMSIVEMLYDAYVHSGDLYLNENDIYRAYDAYLNASRLPVEDVTLAKGRLAQVFPEITPSPMPTPTATPRPTIAGSTGGAKPTAVQRTATPAPTPTLTGLAGLTNRIVFLSNNPGQPGLWTMAPDGSDRRYLGDSNELMQQYEELVRRYQFSPDQRSMVYVMGPKSTAQVFTTVPSSGSGSTTRQITSQSGANYDPSWSPDGAFIVYVSQDSGSDDIWLMAPDGSGKTDLTPNRYYDKHPSWSPDARSITFWSNQAGGQQIFVMYADGSGVRNISNSPWEEYDPVWIR